MFRIGCGYQGRIMFRTKVQGGSFVHPSWIGEDPELRRKCAKLCNETYGIARALLGSVTQR